MMNLTSQKFSLLILGATSLAYSRIMFFFFNDPEGPNLLVVLGMAMVIYFVSWSTYFLLSLANPKKLLLVMLIQAGIATAFYFLV